MIQTRTLGATTGQIVTSSTGTALSIATPTIAHAITAASWGIPVVGAAVAGVTLALTAIFSRKGPKQKVATTHMVEELAPQLQANLDAYMNGPRTKESQQVALANFDAAWSYLTSTQACGSPEMGNPGKACIADRSPGGKWDWFSYYRDPIANDTTPGSSAIVGVDVAGIPNEILIAAACLIAAVVI